MLSYVNRDLEQDIRTILRRRCGIARATTEECKQWARAFIRRQMGAAWYPGKVLTGAAYQKLGERFEAVLHGEVDE